MADTVRTTAALQALMADAAPRNSTTRQMIRDMLVSLDLRPGYAQADAGHQILMGIGATVNVAQVAGQPAYVMGEGATAWGQDNISIGTQAVAGQTSAKRGAICIGFQATINAVNGIKIGNNIAFGGAAGDDGISIGTQSGVAGNATILIGRGTQGSTNCISIGHTASCTGTEGIAIGHNAACGNTGVNYFGVAIGNGANCGVNNGQSAIAIGKGATASNALAQKLIAIGEGASIVANVSQAIVIGAGAGVTVPAISNEVIFGDSLNGNHIAIFTIRTAAGQPIKHRTGASGAWTIVSNDGVNTHLDIDSSATADDFRMRIWDVSAAGLKRIVRGAADSGGAGFRMLRCLN